MEENKKGSRVNYNAVVYESVNIFKHAYNLCKRQPVQENVGNLLSAAGGIVMAAGNPICLIGGGIAVLVGGIISATAPKRATEVELKKKVVELLSEIQQKMDVQHKEIMDKLEDINKLIYKGFLEVKHSLSGIDERVKEIQGQLLKYWNTSKFHEFQAYFKTFFEKRHVDGEQEAYEYLKKHEPETFKNMLAPQYLATWLAELDNQQLPFRMKFGAVEAFFRYRWMVFILIFDLSLRKQPKTSVDPVLYACQTLKDDFAEYYQLSQKYIRSTILHFPIEQHDCQPEFCFDQRKFIEDLGQQFEFYQISKIKVKLCCHSSQDQIVTMQTTFMHRSYRTTIQTPQFGSSSCLCDKSKIDCVIEFKPEEFITKFAGDGSLNFITNKGQVFPKGSELSNLEIEKEVIGFVLIPDDYGHLSIGSVYSREAPTIAIQQVVAKDSIQQLSYNFTQEPWDEKDQFSTILLNAGIQEYFISLIFNPDQNFISQQAFKSLENATGNTQVKELILFTPLENINQKYWLDSISTNPELKALKWKFTKSEEFANCIPIMEKIGQCFPNLHNLVILNQIDSPVVKKIWPDFCDRTLELIKGVNQWVVQLYLKGFNLEDKEVIEKAFDETKRNKCKCYICDWLEASEQELILRLEVSSIPII